MFSRVHITEATLKHLNKAYEVEEGNGHLRDAYLKELNIKTYLVIDPRVSTVKITFLKSSSFCPAINRVSFNTLHCVHI